MNIRVDSTHLYPGKLNLTFGFHFGTISGFDVTNPQLGPLFSIPITVCKPDSVPSKEETSFIQYNNLSFKPGDIIRNFVSVPSTANFAEIKISTKGRLTPARFLVHLLQLHPQSRYTVFEHEYAFGLVSSGIENITSYKKSLPVLPGVTLEVCLAQFWSSLDQCNVSVELSFHSVLVSASSGTQSVNGATGMSGGSNLLINSGNYGFTRFDVATPLRRESLTPKVLFNKVEKSFRPTDNSVGPLKSRDVLPNGTFIHELVNTYSVKIDDASSVYFKVPRFKQMLYDSSLDNFAIYVFDKNNKPLVFQDIYGEEQKFKEGDYTVLVQFASADLQLLKSLESTCLIAEYKLEAPIELPLANKIGDLGKAGSKVGTIVSGKGERKVFWAGEIAKIPKVAKAGDLLTGSFEFVGNDEKIDGILYTVAYLVPPEFKPKEIDLSIKEPEKDDSVKFSEAVRDLEISWVAKMKSIESKLDLAKTLAIRYPDSLELDQQTLLIINEEDCANSIRIAERISLVESILAKVDQTEVAVYYGQNIEAIHQKEKNLQKVMALKKDVIALSFKAFAKLYASLELPDGPEKVANDKLFDDYLLKYTQWTAAELTDDGQYLILFAIQQRRKKFYGIALDKIVKYLSNPKNVSKQEYSNLVTIKTELIDLLGWDLWKKHNDNWKVVDFPVERAHF
jgi:tripeptidyl-peptidase-2